MAVPHNFVVVREWGAKPNRIAAGPFSTRAKAAALVLRAKRECFYSLDSKYYIVRVNLVTPGDRNAEETG